MKGLLLKDLYQIFRYCRAYLFMAVAFIAVSVFQNDAMFVLYPCVLGGMLPITLLAYDEKEKWEQYAGTLPVSRAQLVGTKYLLGFLIMAVLAVLLVAAQSLRMLMQNSFAVGQLTGLLSLLSGSLLAPAVVLPFVFRLGVEKGRIAYYVAIGIACGIIVFSVNNPRDSLSISAAGQPLLVLASLALYAISWALSVAMYNKREL